MRAHRGSVVRCADVAGGHGAVRARGGRARRVGALEAAYGARVGVWVLDTGSGQVLQHRADERFAHASVLKLLLVALTLRDAADLDVVVPVEADDVLEYAPTTSQYVGTGLPLRQVMEAAIVVSDNTAANLLVEQLGGTARCRSWCGAWATTSPGWTARSPT